MGATRCKPPPPNTEARLPGSRLDGDALAEDGAGRDPPVDPPAVVADLEPPALDRLDQVEVLPAVDLAQHDVADAQRRRVHRGDGAELARLDLAGHGVAAGAERHRLARPQLLDVPRGPAHRRPSSRRP